MRWRNGGVGEEGDRVMGSWKVKSFKNYLKDRKFKHKIRKPFLV